MKHWLALAFLPLLPVAACGGSHAPPATEAPRPSGQSQLMTSTFAGQNACNPKNHDRPFIIEWDATDVSSFESRASTDAIFVRYEGCNLQVIDTCTNDSVRGAFGSYMPVDWTSGSLEKIDIANEAELFAKLPLGVGSLAGRVRAGEQFHMEYFVSGTRRATRPYVYRGELDKIPGCRGVTHVVYAYNLGAFALGSLQKLHGEAGATLWGAGVGGASNSLSKAEKRGGVLPSCRAESAKETDTCKTPIRLTLREIQDGDNPDTVAAAAPETPDALNLAGKIQATNDRERTAIEHLNAAQAKLTAGDGRGCLRELDEHDRLDPRPATLSSSAKSYVSIQRASCLMAAGQCQAGKLLARRGAEATSPAGTAPDAIDQRVDMYVTMYCAGGDAQPRDQLLHSLYVLTSSQQRLEPRTCRALFDTAKRALPLMKPDDPNSQVKDAVRRLYNDAAMCFARAGDCAAGWVAQKEAGDLVTQANLWKVSDDGLRSSFTDRTRELCLGKAQGALTPREELLRATQELDLARNVPEAARSCAAIYAKGRAVVLRGRANDPDLQGPAGHLRENVVACFAKAQDCTAAWRAHGELYRWQYADATDARVRDEFTQHAGWCRDKPETGLSPRERIFFLEGVLRRGNDVDRNTCQSAYSELRQLVSQAGPDDKDTELKSVRENMGEHLTRCLVKARACDDAKRAYRSYERESAARRGRPADDASADAAFARNYRECGP